MYMNNIIPNNTICFKGLVPLKDYNGTILKLTKKDKAEIARLQQEIVRYDIEKMKIAKLIKKTNVWAQRDRYTGDLDYIDAKIKDIRDMIKQIKINRLDKQKAKLAKANTKKLDTLA